MWSSPEEDPVKEPITDTLLQYGGPTSCYITLAVTCLTLLLCQRRLLAALRTLWDIYRLLGASPEILKSIALLMLVYLWFLPLMAMTVHYSTIFTYLSSIIMDIQICFLALTAEGAFKALKKKVKEYYKLLALSLENGGLLLYFDEPCLKRGLGPAVDNISRLRQVHRQLVSIMATVNHNYNLSILVIIFVCRFFFTTYLYRWIATKFITLQLVYALLILQRIFYLCYRYEALKRIEKSTADMINGLDKSPLDLRTRAEFKLFLIQLKSHKMAFNCLQMFDLDFSLITSMFTTTITYLMLLQQLK